MKAKIIKAEGYIKEEEAPSVLAEYERFGVKIGDVVEVIPFLNTLIFDPKNGSQDVLFLFTWNIEFVN